MTPAFAAYRALAEKRKKSGFASLTEEEKWHWHASDYAIRRIVLNVARDVHTSPRDPDGQWFDEGRVRDAEAMYHAERGSQREPRRDLDEWMALPAERRWPNATPEQRAHLVKREREQERERRAFCAEYLPTPSAERNADGMPSAAALEFAALCVAQAIGNLGGKFKRPPDERDQPTGLDIRATQEALGLSSKPAREYTADEMAQARRELGLPDLDPPAAEAAA